MVNTILLERLKGFREGLSEVLHEQQIVMNKLTRKIIKVNHEIRKMENDEYELA